MKKVDICRGPKLGPLQVSSSFIPNNPQKKLYKYNLRTFYNFCTTGQDLCKYDFPAEPPRIQALETDFFL